MTLNAAYTREYLDIMTGLSGDIPGRRKAHAYMEQSTAIVHNTHVISSFVPRLFDRATYDEFKSVSETTHSILCKVMQRYLDDAEYRTVFSFDERMVDLILIPRGYDALLPFARVDVFMNEDNLTCGFCEFNADGSSGMNENRELTASIHGTPTFDEFSNRHHVQECELFYSWVDEFASIYSTFTNKVASPRFAICDFLNANAVTAEFEVYRRCFEDRGYPCTICDVRDLRFDGSVLHDADGNRIDAIWRRSVTNDILDHWDESQQLIEAVHAGAVALIGSFAGHIVHDKQIFDVLFHPQTQAFLTQSENDFIARHVPRTRFLEDGEVDIKTIRAHKDDWIIKPTDRYGSADVYSGNMCTKDEWNALIDRFANGAAGAPFLVQTFLKPYRTQLVPPDFHIDEESDEEVSRAVECYNNLNGLYLFNGSFTGVFSRLGPKPVISEPNGDLTSATLWVDCGLPQ